MRLLLSLHPPADRGISSGARRAVDLYNDMQLVHGTLAPGGMLGTTGGRRAVCSSRVWQVGLPAGCGSTLVY